MARSLVALIAGIAGAALAQQPPNDVRVLDDEPEDRTALAAGAPVVAAGIVGKGLSGADALRPVHAIVAQRRLRRIPAGPHPLPHHAAAH
jgi:hypothetical protein